MTHGGGQVCMAAAVRDDANRTIGAAHLGMLQAPLPAPPRPAPRLPLPPGIAGPACFGSA